MDSDERIAKFYSDIDEWIKNNKIGYGSTFESEEEVQKILNFKREEISSLTNEECMVYSYVLQQYANHLSLILGREKAAKQWASDGIWYIVSDKMSHDRYAKWEEKYYGAIKQSELAKNLMKLKSTCESRVNILTDTLSNVKSMSETLMQLGRSKRSY